MTARAACGREIVATSGKTECDTPSDPSHTGTTSSTGAIIPDRQDSDDCYYLGTALPIKKNVKEWVRFYRIDDPYFILKKDHAIENESSAHVSIGKTLLLPMQTRACLN